jgi:phosphoglucomutase
MKDYMQTYESWKTALSGTPYETELIELAADPENLQESFYRELEFGTAGMRGILGLGTNRMNDFIVRRLTKGLADYLNEKGVAEKGVAIAYDSRRNSDRFAREAAGVFCANGVKVFLSPTVLSVPQLSFSILEIGAAAGVVITASHNPPMYNGYKAYGSDGGQLDPEDADIVTKYIEKVPDLFHIESMDLEQAQKEGLLEYMSADLLEIYYSKVKNLLIHPDVVRAQAEDLNIVYTPLFGAGNIPVRRILSDIGISRLHVVPEQENPDPDFPGLKAPNPEDPDTFKLAIALADRVHADLILATDPDSDRLGLAARTADGTFKLFTGNQIGCLLMDYVISQTSLSGDEFVVKSIVSSAMADAIAAHADVEIRSVYTGFKFIAEQIKLSLQTGAGRFLFGYEESFGYLKGTFVRDKDAIIASMLVCETACWYAARNMTLWDAMDELYKKYGYYADRVISKTLAGMEGIQKISNAMTHLRKNPISEIGGMKVRALRDYSTLTRTDDAGNREMIVMTQENKSNVLFYELDDGHFILRPSGTEPKIKSYISYKGKTENEAAKGLARLEKEVAALLDDLTT